MTELEINIFDPFGSGVDSAMIAGVGGRTVDFARRYRMPS